MVEDEVVIVVGGEVESEPFSGVWDIFADALLLGSPLQLMEIDV